MSEMTCEWPVSYAECGTCSALTPENTVVFEEMATDFLRAWTGLGTCPLVVRPCRTECEGVSTFWGFGPYPMLGSSGYIPVLVQGRWYNVSCGRCGNHGCSCTELSEIRLPGPIASVDEVLVDGAVLPPTSYRVDNECLLVRTDGDRWPTCQDLAAPPSAPGTWQVSYSYGRAVPLGGQVAAGILACEMAKASCKDASCQLPERVKQITRQGITVALLDDFKALDDGRTGIWLIDSWVASVTKPQRVSRVLSPDVPRPNPRRTTWQATGP